MESSVFAKVAGFAQVRSVVLSFVLLVGVAGAVGSLIAAYAQPAGATFPGTPGKIAYYRSDGNDLEIYTIRPDGGGKYQVTHNRVRQDLPNVEYADDIHPAYSPNGRRIAYVYYDGPHTVLYTIKPSGEDRRKVITRGTFGIAHPAYAPDGKRIAYVGYDGHFDQIFSVKVRGGGLLNLTKISSYAEDDSCGVSPAHGGPDYSPDGKTIAYTGWDGNDLEICTINTNGTNKRQLTHNNSVDRQPSYSPNGKRIAYSGGQVWIGPGPTETEIYTIKAAGGDKRRLTNDKGFQGSPSYSPNGERIAYNSNEDGDREIYTMKVGGGDKRQLTHNTILDINPSWGSR